MTTRRIVLAGGSGFLGQALAKYLQPLGWIPTVLTRHLSCNPSFREVEWDGRTLADWVGALDGAAAVINLAGRSVNCRFTPENKRLVMDSRVDATRVLGKAIAQCSVPPHSWLNAGTATIYRHTFGPPHGETSTDFAVTPEVKDEFSVEVALAWERALCDSATPKTRQVALRTTLVFGTIPGGVFQILRRLSRWGLGGRMGDGRQYVSWIHELDFCRAVEWILNNPNIAGPVNIAAPKPVTNSDMMRIFRRACGTPLGVPAGRPMLELGAFCLRTETELLLKSRYVIPAALLAHGFHFHFPDMEGAVRDLQRQVSRAR